MFIIFCMRNIFRFLHNFETFFNYQCWKHSSIMYEISIYSCLCFEMWLHLSVLFLADISSLSWRKVCGKTWCIRLSWNTQKSLWFWNGTVRSSSLTYRVRNTQNTKHTDTAHMHKRKTCFIHSFNIKCIIYYFANGIFLGF